MGKRETRSLRNGPGQLMTRWAHELDPARPLPEYPRPQMVRREWLNLNGLWEYAILPAGTDDPSRRDGKILVPFPVESALSGVKRPLRPGETLRYRRCFTVPETWSGRRVLLQFGAVDWKAEVIVNGAAAGGHTGGYSPFTIEITPYLTAGENELVVLVRDPTDAGRQERGKQALKPGGIFYTAVSGIWQTVWIEPVPDTCIGSLRLTPDIDRRELSVRIELSGPAEGFELEAEARDADRTVSRGTCPADRTLRLPVPEMRLWSPETPFLYGLTVRLLRGGIPVDEAESYFGMRKFGIGPDSEGRIRLLLNDRPVFQNGVLDQGYWPDGLYTAPTDEALAYDPETAKAMGFNMIRKHVKVEPARWYHHCDRLGLIVWQDMPNGGSGFRFVRHALVPFLTGGRGVRDDRYRQAGREDETCRNEYRTGLREMIDALHNAPCIAAWVPFNEGWGQFDAAETAAWVKRYDSSRWVDHASGWFDRGAGEMRSVHTYFRRLSIPRRLHGRAAVISEYGGYSMTVPGHAWREDREFGYRTFDSAERLFTAYRSLIGEQLRPLVPAGLSAAVYTQLTDVETETNGLLTYDRKLVKLEAGALRELHRSLTR